MIETTTKFPSLQSSGIFPLRQSASEARVRSHGSGPADGLSRGGAPLSSVTSCAAVVGIGGPDIFSTHYDLL